MKNDYTLKEILLGLREEQMKVARRLKFLKNNLIKDESTDITDFDFSPEELSIIYNYWFKLNLFQWDFISLQLKEDSKGSFASFYLPIIKEKKMEFDDNCQSILKNEFVNNSCQEIKTNYGRLVIRPNCIFYFVDDCKVSKSSKFAYFSKSDSVVIKNATIELNPQDRLQELLDLTFKREDFSDYLQEIIDTSSEREKDVFVSGEKRLGKAVRYYLNPIQKSYILTKR